jgi:predicted dehydrogenase
MTSPVRIGILGTARIAVPALIGAARPIAQDVVVAAVAARESSRASGYAAQHGIPVAYGSYDQLLADPGIDAVYNPLPNSLHAAWTLKAIAAGKHVLCEKPFASNAAEAAEVAEAADEAGLIVMEAMHYRYHPLITKLVSHAEQIGPVRHIQCWTSFTIADPSNIRYDYRLGGGALMDGGCYALDCIRLLTGEPEVRAAVCGPVPGHPDVDQATAARLDFPGGSAWVDSAFTRDGDYRADLHVIGDNGYLRLSNFIFARDGHLVVTSRDGVVADIRGGGDTTYTWQLRALAAAIQRGEPFPTTAANAVTTMRLIDDCYLAAGFPLRG